MPVPDSKPLDSTILAPLWFVPLQSNLDNFREWVDMCKFIQKRIDELNKPHSR